MKRLLALALTLCLALCALPAGAETLQDCHRVTATKKDTTQENGSVMISEDVVATIVAHALSEVEGVGSLGVKPGVSIADFTNKKNWGKGLKILIAEDNTLTIECGIMVCYGYSVVDVAKDVQAAVTASVESITGTKVASVSVNVCGIVHK